MQSSLAAGIFAVLSLTASCNGIPLEGRITGGADVDISDHPYQLSLFSSNTILFRGGAVIISASWALTSSQNLDEQPNDDLSLRAGSTQLSEGGYVHRVAEIVVHDQHVVGEKDYDLALLKVATPFVFGPGVAACVLPAQGESVAVGVASVVSGWGGKSSGSAPGFPSEILQAAVIPTLDNSACQEAYGVAAVTDRMLCAGIPEDSALDACNGDEGGPMVVDGVVVGIVSWRYWRGCGYFGSPGVYAKVSSMRDWILATSGV